MRCVKRLFPFVTEKGANKDTEEVIDNDSEPESESDNDSATNSESDAGSDSESDAGNDRESDSNTIDLTLSDEAEADQAENSNDGTTGNFIFLCRSKVFSDFGSVLQFVSLVHQKLFFLVISCELPTALFKTKRHASVTLLCQEMSRENAV